MAEITLNAKFDADKASTDLKGKYLFVEEGKEPIELVVWNEKSKANDKHPEGKPWIRLPKDNITNRAYFSEDLFKATAVDGKVEVEIKTAPPRVLGSNGLKQEILKYLPDEVAEEYVGMVNAAIEKYKAAKGTNKKKKPEEMTRQELEAYIEALKTGASIAASTTGGVKSFLDMFTEEEYARYNEILGLAQENKANAPKVKRGPLSDAEKAARNKKRQANEITKAEALLKALEAGGAMNSAPAMTNVSEEVDDDYDEIDDVDYEDVEDDE